MVRDLSTWRLNDQLPVCIRFSRRGQITQILACLKCDRFGRSMERGTIFFFAPFSSMLACSDRTFRALVLLLVYQQVIYFLLQVSFLLAPESGLAIALFSKPPWLIFLPVAIWKNSSQNLGSVGCKQTSFSVGVNFKTVGCAQAYVM